jgi:hypothetical protein
MLYMPEPSDGRRGSPSVFYHEVAAIAADPEVRRLALRRAGNRELAEDALQETFYAVARVKNPGRIENLRAFFCRALINEIRRQLLATGPIFLDDPDATLGHRQQSAAHFGRAAHRAVDDEAVAEALAGMLRGRLLRDRYQLEASVPGRSRHPGRYRSMIVSVAERMLHAVASAQVTGADSNLELQRAYPEWFGEPGCTRDASYQRLSRARRDVRTLLMTVVSRDELSP